MFGPLIHPMCNFLNFLLLSFESTHSRARKSAYMVYIYILYFTATETNQHSRKVRPCLPATHSHYITCLCFPPLTGKEYSDQFTCILIILITGQVKYNSCMQVGTRDFTKDFSLAVLSEEVTKFRIQNIWVIYGSSLLSLELFVGVWYVNNHKNPHD